MLDELQLFPDTDGPIPALVGLSVSVLSSEHDDGVSRIANDIRSLLSRHGATVLPNLSTAASISDSLRKTQLQGADLIIVLALTAGTSAEALKICAVEKSALEKLLIFMPNEFADGFIYKSFIRHKAAVQLLPSDNFTNGHDAALCDRIVFGALEVALTKRSRMALRPRFAPRIALVTALPEEYRAGLRILDNFSVQPDPDHRRTVYRTYVHGQIPTASGDAHDVVLALSGKGNNKAAILATQIMHDYKTVEVIFMVGIAAGVPNPKKPDVHVRLGDVVVADEYGVIQYDMVKEDSFSVEFVPPPRPPDAKWLHAMEVHVAISSDASTPKYWEYIDDICRELRIKRPARGVLKDNPWNPETRATRHPSDVKRTTGKPKLFQGRIGSANTVLKTPRVRDLLREKFKVRAIEMEASGIADATWENGKGYMVVRGVADYANDGKADAWHAYAAAVAAAFTKELISSMPCRGSSQRLLRY